MAVRVPLLVKGVDLNDDAVAAILAEEQLFEVLWGCIDGRVVANVFLDSSCIDPVSAILDFSRQIERMIPDSQVVRVDDELVSTTDIAERSGFSREMVRLCAAGTRGPGGFPGPLGTVSSKGKPGIKVWAWREVSNWFLAQYHLTLDDQALEEKQISEINSHLAHLQHPVDHDWQRIAEWPAARPPLVVHLLSSAHFSTGVTWSAVSIRGAGQDLSWQTQIRGTESTVSG